MINLKTKIQQTRLLSDAQKIALLAQWEDLSEEEKQKLEKVINEYDQKYHQMVTKLKKEVDASLGVLENNEDTQELQDARELIRAGLNTLAS